ncbi:hypothetical protein [Magnetofaba australis]|nr:hypothetical protein [Magnetofaba australis]
MARLLSVLTGLWLMGAAAMGNAQGQDPRAACYAALLDEAASWGLVLESDDDATVRSACEHNAHDPTQSSAALRKQYAGRLAKRDACVVGLTQRLDMAHHQAPPGADTQTLLRQACARGADDPAIAQMLARNILGWP